VDGVGSVRFAILSNDEQEQRSIMLDNFSPENERDTDQQQFVQGVLSGCPGGIVVVSGRPGSGKSATLARVSVSLLLTGHRVLVAAQSDSAVNTIFDKVAAWLLREMFGDLHFRVCCYTTYSAERGRHRTAALS